jgi:outer membrane receptor for ferrienterochelin and colicin
MSSIYHSYKNFSKIHLPQLSLLIACLSQSTAYASNSLWDMSLEELGKIRVTSLASGTATPLDKAAAIATVITSEDIEAMGARDIDEVLETVPGLHVGRLPYSPPLYNIRGIASTHTPQTLIMINGVPISSLYIGHPSLIWGGMPVKAISKIEVIRGPGSALYGADAFAGVINIVTKGGNDIQQDTAGVQVGSFNTKSAWASYGTRQHNTDIGLTLEYSQTDGFDSVVSADAQTLLDSITGANASLAPHQINMGRQMLDARLQLDGDNWTSHVGFQRRYHLEMGTGIAQAIDDQGRYSSDRINTDLSYRWQQLPDNFKLSTRLSYYYNDQQATTDNLLYPAGSNTIYDVSKSPNLFPNGVVGNPEYREEQARFNIDGEFNGFKNHILRAGTGFFWGDIYEVTEQKNFLPNLQPRPNGIEEVADTAEVFLPEKGRTNYSIYAQDEWLFDPQWALTTGVRYDDYSDFGDTINPRLALVWANNDSITTKLLYGRAFRAPSISELFAVSNPVTLGNPDLQPESIDTYELAFSHQVSSQLSYSSNIFYYQISDFIAFEFNPVTLAKQAQNTGNIQGQGFEHEMTYTPTDTLKLTGNYSYQKTQDKTNGGTVGKTPNHELYLRAEWQITPNYHLNSQVTWVGEQQRSAGDDRAPVASYTTVDVNLQVKQLIKNLDMALIVKNAFDADVREASQPPLKPFYPVAFVPNDYPMAGRSIFAELAYKF